MGSQLREKAVLGGRGDKSNGCAGRDSSLAFVAGTGGMSLAESKPVKDEDDEGSADRELMSKSLDGSTQAAVADSERSREP